MKTKAMNYAPFGIAVFCIALVGVGIGIWQAIQPKIEFQNLETITDPPRKHIKNAKFYDLPPMGGDHNLQWQNCGVYDKPIQTEHAVHSLEHGAVWIAYQPDISAAERKALVKFALGRPYVLVSPLAKMQSPIAIVAWGHRIKLQTINEDVMARFIQRFAGSLKAPEPAGPCIGGIGNPRW